MLPFATLSGSCTAPRPEAAVADRAAIAEAISAFGDIDVLVANAGLTHYMPFAELPPERAEEMNAVNWIGTLNTVAAGLPELRPL